MRIEGYPQKKNQLIGRLGVLTGKQPVYNGAPDFSYDIGDYRILRDGSVVVLEESLDTAILDDLISEKLVVDPNPGLPAKDIEPTEAVIQESIPERIPERAVTSPAWNYGVASQAHTYDNPIVIKARIVPVSTMINLLNMLYAKGEVLSRAVGKHKAFWISDDVIAEIPYQKPTSYQSLMKILKTKEKADLVKGVEFQPDAVIFTGFPQTDDFLKRKAYEKLAECLYDYAASRQWISCKKTDVQNEKYFCRNFFNQIGLKGKENKTIRDILLKNLEGNSSYRTKAQLLADRNRRREAYVHKRRNQVSTLTTAM